MCSDVMLIALGIREAADLGPPGALRKLVMHYIDALSASMRGSGVEAGAADDVTYALVALLDEAVLSVAGTCRQYWLARPLQLELFGSNVAGEEFYSRLARLLKNWEQNKSVIEVYHLCLSLGFEGKYRLSCKEERVSLMSEIGKRLGATGGREHRLSPHGLPGWRRRRAAVPPELLRLIAFSAFCLVVLGAMWVILGLVCSGECRAALAAMEEVLLP
jgi:type VI secretion system protein ImpK